MSSDQQMVNTDHKGVITCVATTENLESKLRDMAMALRSEYGPNETWLFEAKSDSRMLSTGLLPPMYPAPRRLFGLPITPRAPPSVVQQAIQGQVQQDAQRHRSRLTNRGGIQKSGLQETSPSARDIATRIQQDPALRRDIEEFVLRREQQSSRAPQEKGRKAVPCGNCLMPGHTVRDCVHPAVDGFVHGCPICNGADHESAQGCKMDWPKRLEKRLLWAIGHRARRPTLAAFSNWMEMFAEARDNGHVALPQSFPWTPFYSLRLMKSQTYPWQTFDYTSQSPELPRDPLTADQNTVNENQSMLRALPSYVVGTTGGRPWIPSQQ
ncbi:hypothetical protein J3459_011970 [Metarhizium acridum]|nr:hypothetical protein J3459_011970 [Metarhizium acridum]